MGHARGLILLLVYRMRGRKAKNPALEVRVTHKAPLGGQCDSLKSLEKAGHPVQRSA